MRDKEGVGARGTIVCLNSHDAALASERIADALAISHSRSQSVFLFLFLGNKEADCYLSLSLSQDTNNLRNSDHQCQRQQAKKGEEAAKGDKKGGMRWRNETQLQLQQPILRFSTILLLTISLFALIALFIESITSMAVLSRGDRIAPLVVLRKNRLAIVTSAILTLTVAVKIIFGILAINHLHQRLLRTFFLLQPMSLAQSAVLVWCQFHSSYFFLISSSAELICTSLILIRIRKNIGPSSSSCAPPAAVVVTDGVSIIDTHRSSRC